VAISAGSTRRALRGHTLAIVAFAIGSLSVGLPVPSKIGWPRALALPRTPAAAEAPLVGPHARGVDQVPTTTLRPEDLPAAPPVSDNPTADFDRAGVLAEGAEGSGEIALTFDDGPGVDTTPEVLRILEAHHVKGAFFLTGQRLGGAGVVAEMNRGVAHAIAAAGHTIGNHGLEHHAVDRSDAPWVARQIEESARLIEAATGKAPRWFRPPYGKIGAVGSAMLAARGDELVMWTLDAQDVSENDPERLAKRLEGQIIFAGQGIVLLHDLRPTSVRALALLLDWLDAHPRDDAKGTGYRVVDLPSYFAHAAAHPYPYRDRVEVFHARSRVHARRADR
jgi:peptidoglycan/xylan/chitin deacetylase (PgdA/CDA1 family)